MTNLLCYICNDPLIEGNNSKEHILPNSIGGRLKSGDLLCKICNQTTGQLFDDVFGEFALPYASKYSIKRERGNVPNFKAIAKNGGTELIVKPGWHINFLHPVVQYLPDGQISVTSSSLNRYTQEMARLKSQLLKENLFIEELRMFIDNTPLSVDFVYERFINQDLLLRSVCKTFANFFIHSGGDRRDINRIIDFLKEDVENLYCWFCDLSMIRINYGEKPYHLLFIRGDQKQKAIYAYLEIFGEKGFVSLLNGRYDGTDFQFSYMFDPLNIETIPFHNCPLKTS